MTNISRTTLKLAASAIAFAIATPASYDCEKASFHGTQIGKALFSHIPVRRRAPTHAVSAAVPQRIQRCGRYLSASRLPI